MPHLTEAAIEELAIERLQAQGYNYVSGGEIAPDGDSPERDSYEKVLLRGRLEAALQRINPWMNANHITEVIRQIERIHSPELVANNETFHRLLTEGVPVSIQRDGNERGERAWLVDFAHLEKNEFLTVNQFTVVENNRNRRPDIILFVNGLPLVVMELKNAAEENATIGAAFRQIETYKEFIPSLFTFNAFSVISDGIEARAGTISAGMPRFMRWKTADGKTTASPLISEMETLICGMLKPAILLDLVRHFIVFEKDRREIMPSPGSFPSPDSYPSPNLSQRERDCDEVVRGERNSRQTVIETVKKMAAYHQYHAVNAAVESTLRAAGYTLTQPLPEGEELGSSSPEGGKLDSSLSPWERDRVRGVTPSENQVRETMKKGDRKGGVVWHTQGSGKSLSMVFYTGKIVLALDNPTVLVITDRNDLDDQLFDTFAASKQLLRQDPVQAENRAHLKKLLKVSSGGVVFSTIQKFQPAEGNQFEQLSDRKNIIVIADEAHRTQYGFAAKTIDDKSEAGEIIGKKIVYGFAKYMRDALPNATYLGFTGTPIESTDINTPAVFGNYVDIYDIAQAVQDGATVPIYYESRLAKVLLSDEGKKQLDELDKELDKTDLSESQKAKAKWARMEALIGSKKRRANIAQDIVGHFEARQEVMQGKGMIVCMSRRIAAGLHEEIIKLRPQWFNEDLRKGAVKVIITASSSDGPLLAKHHTSKDERRVLADRMRDVDDPLQLAIVCDMWLTGFDVPCLHTMYLDKPMRGHNLMQAIARVNRVYKDKTGGLIVDYLGIASDLKKALSFYSDAGGKGDPAHTQQEAVALMLEKLEIVSAMFHGFDYEKYFSADTAEKLNIILAAADHILGLEDGKKRFLNEVTALSKAFSIAIPHEQALDVKDEVGFFQAVKARLTKFEASDGGMSDERMETTIRQVIDEALVSEGVVDIFDAAGIKKPDISILSDEFLAELKDYQHKNVALEVLKKILNDELRTRQTKNLVESKKLKEMLEEAIRRYQNKILTAAEVIDELIKISKKIVESDAAAQEMGLSDYEYAFYCAVADNESARELMQKEKLRELAVVLTDRVRNNAGIDWSLKESARSRLRVLVKRTLRKYKYPPDMQKLATDLILAQAKKIAEGIQKAV